MRRLDAFLGTSDADREVRKEVVRAVSDLEDVLGEAHLRGGSRRLATDQA